MTEKAKRMKNLFEILHNKKPFMEKFFDEYCFNKAGVDKNKFVDNKKDFLKFISFCLNTRQRVVNRDLENAKLYFKDKHTLINKLIKKGDVKKLEEIIYNAPGVGQKIGSMMLEFIFMYSGYKSDKYLKEINLPIDTHVKRVLEESFKNTKVPNINASYKSKKYVDFQKEIQGFTKNDLGRAYFDYLWFIGKVFCKKDYKLCNICWIKEVCMQKKWNL